MTRKTIQILAATVVILVAILVVLRSNDSNDPGVSDRLLIAGFKGVANTATEIRVSRYTAGDDVTIHREDNAWLLRERDNYPADIVKIRQLVIAMADAQIIEEKTSDEEKYDRLGVYDPKTGGSGVDISITGPDFSYSIILGDETQSDFRYARIEGEATSYLINQNPEIPNAINDWLSPDIINIESTSIREVRISHAGADSIGIEKADQEQTNFTVLDVPAGRELSYSAVGNGIAGALRELKLQDVRTRVEAEPSTRTVYRTWEGLVVTVELVSDDDESWAAFSAEVAPTETANESTEEDASNTEASALTLEANEINKRLSGWQFQLADYKKNLLTRRWEDMLKSTDETPSN